jgi:hypothetical protein
MADLDVRYEWRTLGKLSVRDGRLTFPEVGHVPGVYSFRFSGSRGFAEYIGEAADLSRRWYSYARPGPTQRTNLRLSPVLLEAVSACEVEVRVAANAILVLGNESTDLDLNGQMRWCG